MKRSRRRGISLLEVIAAMTFSVILLGLGARTLVALIRIDRSGRDRLADDGDLARLTRDFRADLHASESSAIADPSSGILELKIGKDRLIRYSADNGEIVRSDRTGDQPVTRRAYPLNGRQVPVFEAVGEGQSRLVRLRLRPPKETTRESSTREVVVEAHAGWDGRFRSSKGGADAGSE